MELYLKAAAIVLLSVILGVSIDKTEKDLAIVLRIAACCGVTVTAVHYLSPVVDYFWKMIRLPGLQEDVASSLLRITGIALLTEIITNIGSDAGSGSVGKAMHLLGNAAILYFALPLFESFFSILQELLILL